MMRYSSVAIAILIGGATVGTTSTALRAKASTPQPSVEPSIDKDIETAVAAVQSRVVQLRYFGAGGDALGNAAAPVTGYDAGGGWILTSTYGLQQDPAAIVCRFGNDSQEQASVVARDHGRRLALLQLRDRDASAPPEATGRRPRVGETAIALGRVYNNAVQLSVGVVSARDRFGGRALQTDALASPLNYGGPLIGLDGNLLGILTPLSPAGQRGVALYDSGVGFAVPSAELQKCLPTLARGVDLQPGWLGVSLGKANPLVTAAKLSKVTPEGPAELAGLIKGDRIVTLAGQSTPSVWRLRAVLGGLDAGQSVLATVVGIDGRTRSTEITLAEPPEPPAKSPDVTLPIKQPDEP